MRSCQSIEETGMAIDGSLKDKYTNCHGADYSSRSQLGGLSLLRNREYPVDK